MVASISPIDQRQLQQVSRPTWLENDLSALADNISGIRRRIGPRCLFYAVVKANAYGHGAELIAPAALEAGVDRLAVAAVNEAIPLREAGVRAPILLLGYTPPELAETILQYDLAVSVYEARVALAFADTASRASQPLTVHLKVDTGMNRLGIDPSDAPELCAMLSESPALNLEGIYTHFSTADETDKEYCRYQLRRFTTLLQRLTRAGCRPPIAHAANSAATIDLPEAHLDAVRCGILLYGLSPSDEVPAPPPMQPVLSWKARIAQVRSLNTGEPVSYGNTWRAPGPRTVAVIPVGYADGFPRSPRTWKTVLIGGQEVPVVGRICMDHTFADVTELTESGIPVARDDEVVLIGEQHGATISMEDAAARLKTNNYEVASRLMARLPRIAT
ncbi:MAG: alanine racemase [Caldilineaceae bacterium]|nr:alanine racemase [Caldilineaceae bacterium]